MSNAQQPSTSRGFFIPILTALVFGLSISILTGCKTLPSSPQTLDCASPQTSCQQGRFGLVWKTIDEQGASQGDSLSGHYEWRTLKTTIPNEEHAILEINSTLGPTLGIAQQKGHVYEVRTSDGQIYQANNWQDLFDLIFPIQLPANALIEWINNPQITPLPTLPNNWHWEIKNTRHRIVFKDNSTSGRIDLIPQTRD